MESGQAVKEEVAETKEAKKNGVDIASFGAGLLITVVVYTCGSLVAHIPGLSKIICWHGPLLLHVFKS